MYMQSTAKFGFVPVKSQWTQRLGWERVILGNFLLLSGQGGGAEPSGLLSGGVDNQNSVLGAEK